MTKIKNLPETERPREKALQYGVRSLSNRELLALILRTGTAGHSVLEVADELLKLADGIQGIARLDAQQMAEISGISKVKAMELQACLELGRRCTASTLQQESRVAEPDQIRAWLQMEIGSQRQEHFLCLYLDHGGHLLHARDLFVGTSTTSVVSPREILRYALLDGAEAILVAHNHPAGTLRPSSADQQTTRLIQQACDAMGILLLDHLIVTQNGVYSFQDNGLLRVVN